MNLRRALVRPISASYAKATVQTPGLGAIDVALARAQHDAYRRALVDAGLDVVVLAEDPALPDSCFVEDQAVVAGGIALLTRTGHVGRRAESAEVEATLRNHLPVVRQTDGTLEGGDVLRVGTTLFVGLTGRTDAAGHRVLRETFGPYGFSVVPVEVPHALHLKCVATSPREDLVFVAEGTVDAAIFDRIAEVVIVPAADAYGANVLGFGARVLVAAGHPRVCDALVRAGLDPVVLDVSEIRKGDGALTCLSVVF